MPRPCDPLSIKAPELAAAPLSMQLAALAEALASVDRDVALTVVHMSARALLLERKVEAIDNVAAWLAAD